MKYAKDLNIAKQSKSQIAIDQIVLSFLGNSIIENPQNLVILKDKILNYFEFYPYNKKTKKKADSIQWKRTASEIIKDAYVYEGKACSDLSIVFLSLCKAVGLKRCLVKLKSIDEKTTHSIVEVKLKGVWYRIDPSSKDSVPFKGQLSDESIWNKKYKVWKRGRDLWDLNLSDKDKEKK